MLFRLLYDDLLAQASYLIGCQRTGEALIVDPGRDTDRYVERAAREGVRIVAAAETHIHADFLSGARQFAEDLGVRVILSGEGGPDWQYGWAGAYDAQIVRHGDRFSIGNIDFRVLHTPGHTPEHVSYLVTDRGGSADEPMGVLTGDFVFVGSLGRPDLLETAAGVVAAKEPAARRLAESARAFLDLPDHLQVWPGHGAGSACGKALGAVPQSTVGYERRFNALLALAGDERAFVEEILDGQPAPPLYFGRMKRENRDGPAVVKDWPRPRRAALPDGRREVVVDTRPWEAFRAGHVPGSLWAPLGAQLPAIAGSYVTPDERVHLIVEEPHADAAVRGLLRIGLDHVGAYSAPEDLEGHAGLVSVPEVDVSEAAARRGDVLILDVRGEHEHAAARIDGTVNVPHPRLLAHLQEIPDDRPVLVHCRSGVRSAYATSLLLRAGREAANVRGGILAWQAAGLPTTPEGVIVP